jgi:transcriptional regulator with XRE-family HTH domain
MVRQKRQAQQHGSNKERFGQLVRQIRLEAGHSLKSAAPKFDVDYSYLSKIENGVVLPSASLLARFAEEYRTDVDSLFLAAGRLPPDIETLIRERPREIMSCIREHFGNGGSER